MGKGTVKGKRWKEGEGRKGSEKRGREEGKWKGEAEREGRRERGEKVRRWGREKGRKGRKRVEKGVGG